VNVLYGSFTGIGTAGADFWYQDGTYVRDGLANNDRFGQSLAAGDFDGNGHDDLAIGVPEEDVDTAVDAGAVNVLYGDWMGLTGETSQFWHQNIMYETAEADDGFGRALAAGDFNGDGRGDLAIGVPYEDVGSTGNAGGVHVVYGSGSGLSRGLQFWHQDSPGVMGTADVDDGFGITLVAMPAVMSRVFLPLALR
jgi:hypothetical protein